MSRFVGRSVPCAVLLGMLLATQASATMPPLSPTPKPASQAACERWAARQDEDAIYMWGMLEAGGSSKPAAITRLTTFCLTGKKPDIVGFGSSVGFDDAYCAKHRAAPICRNR